MFLKKITILAIAVFGLSTLLSAASLPPVKQAVNPNNLVKVEFSESFTDDLGAMDTKVRSQLGQPEMDTVNYLKYLVSVGYKHKTGEDLATPVVIQIKGMRPACEVLGNSGYNCFPRIQYEISVLDMDGQLLKKIQKNSSVFRMKKKHYRQYGSAKNFTKKEHEGPLPMLSVAGDVVVELLSEGSY